MKVWPVPDSFSKLVSKNSFLEDRGDRFHCGVDIYIPINSKVFCIDSGKVVKTGVFTNPSIVPYWNKTFYVDFKMDNNLFCRFAELGRIKVCEGDILKPGDLIGFVGCVLDRDKITHDSPLYIQKLKESGNVSMLHFELYSKKPIDISNKFYIGGNWFGDSKPTNLIDPTYFLNTCKK